MAREKKTTLYSEFLTLDHPIPDATRAKGPKVSPASIIAPIHCQIRNLPNNLKSLGAHLPRPFPIPGVSTSLSAAHENVTLEIRWTILCDLFLVLIVDSVYDHDA